MKKLLIVFTIVAVAFCLICCNAESIVKTGQNLQKVGKINAGYADDVLVEIMNDLTVVLDTYKEQHLGFDPVKGNMDNEEVQALVGTVIMARESSASQETISKILNKEADKVDQNSKRNFGNIKEIVDEFLDDPEKVRAEIKDYLKEALGGLPNYGEKIDEAVNNENFKKIVSVVENIYPAIDAFQSINDQSYGHDGYVTYGDVIANAIYRNTIYNVISLVSSGSSATTDDKMNVIDNIINNLYALEVIYNVTFDVPRIAGNFVGNL
jgi:hypothetical protein